MLLQDLCCVLSPTRQATARARGGILSPHLSLTQLWCTRQLSPLSTHFSYLLLCRLPSPLPGMMGTSPESLLLLPLSLHLFPYNNQSGPVKTEVRPCQSQTQTPQCLPSQSGKS